MDKSMHNISSILMPLRLIGAVTSLPLIHRVVAMHNFQQSPSSALKQACFGIAERQLWS